MNEENKNFLDNIFDDVGEKLQNIAKFIFCLEVIGFIILAIVMFVLAGDSYYGEGDFLTMGFVFLIGGPFVALISAWILYGIGEVASIAPYLKKYSVEEKTDMNVKKEEREPQNVQKHFRCPTCNGDVLFGEKTCKNCGQNFNWDNM